jgi:hypothetical protein
VIRSISGYFSSFVLFSLIKFSVIRSISDYFSSSGLFSLIEISVIRSIFLLLLLPRVCTMFLPRVCIMFLLKLNLTFILMFHKFLLNTSSLSNGPGVTVFHKLMVVFMLQCPTSPSMVCGKLYPTVLNK